MRNPDVIIGPKDVPYLLRWHILPRNPFFNVYLHKFLRSDDDRALHDHPWSNVSILLKGMYLEHTPQGKFLRKAGDIVLRARGSSSHRIELCQGTPCWTLFITGPRYREWGFHCPKGWVHWKRFTDPKNPGEIGRGCE